LTEQTEKKEIQDKLIKLIKEIFENDNIEIDPDK